jgi:hypothetical protein
VQPVGSPDHSPRSAFTTLKARKFVTPVALVTVVTVNTVVIVGITDTVNIMFPMIAEFQ